MPNKPSSETWIRLIVFRFISRNDLNNYKTRVNLQSKPLVDLFLIREKW